VTSQYKAGGGEKKKNIFGTKSKKGGKDRIRMGGAPGSLKHVAEAKSAEGKSPKGRFYDITKKRGPLHIAPEGNGKIHSLNSKKREGKRIGGECPVNHPQIDKESMHRIEARDHLGGKKKAALGDDKKL